MHSLVAKAYNARNSCHLYPPTNLVTRPGPGDLSPPHSHPDPDRSRSSGKRSSKQNKRNKLLCFPKSQIPSQSQASEEEGMFYGAVVWDPWLIVAQIATLQCFYYLTLGISLSLLVGTRVSRITLLYFFDFATLSPSSLTGWAVISSFLLASFAGAGYMLYVIERSKKCLDFSATLYIVHLFICTAYGGWPSSLTWWAANGAGLAVMALLGEYLCIRRELREIPISRLRSNV